MEITEAKYADAEGTIIEATIDGETIFVPVAATGNRHWHAIWDWMTDGNVVAPYVPPVEPGLPNLEPDQFWAAVKFFGFEAALLAWVDSLKPTDLESPTYEQDLAFWSMASAKLERAKYFERAHPMIEGARQALGLTEQQLDNMWMWALS